MELESQRQLLEHLKMEVSLLRKGGAGVGGSCLGGVGSDSSSDTSSTVGSSASQSEWCPQNVLVRGWAPFGCRPAAKIDRREYKKLSEDLLSMLPTGLQNQVVVRAPFLANFQLVLGISVFLGVDANCNVDDAEDQRSTLVRDLCCGGGLFFHVPEQMDVVLAIPGGSYV